MTEFDDAGLTESIQKKVGHVPPFSAEELEQIRLLLVERTDGLTGVSALGQLRDLVVERSRIESVGFLYELEDVALESIEVRYSLLCELAGLENLPSSCVSIDFICTRVADLKPLLEVERALFIDVRGNPLSEQSYYDVLPKLEEKVFSVTYDSQEVWRLNRRLDEQGIAAAYSTHSEDGHRLVPLTDELQFSQEKLVYAVISPDELASELDDPEVDLADLVERYKPATKKKESIWDKRKRGSAEQAREWIQGADLDESLEESLLGFVGRFEEASFVADADETLRHYERYGSMKWDQNRLSFRLPQWFRQVRKTLASVERDGRSMCALVDEIAWPSGWDVDSPVMFSLGAMGAKSFEFGAALVDRHGAYPIAYGGQDTEFVLAIDASVDDDQKIFVFRSSDVFRWDFDPYDHVAFESLAGFLDAIVEVRDGEHGCPSSLLGRHIPQVECDVDGLRDKANTSAEAIAWVESSSLQQDGREALVGVIEAFGQATMVRDTAASIEFYEVLNQARLPDWVRQQRETMAYVELGGQPAKVRFADFPYAWDGFPGDEWFELAAMKVPYSRQRIIEEHRRWPIAVGPAHMLAVGLDGAPPGGIEWIDLEDLAAGNYLRAFDSLGQMFDAIEALRAAGGATLERAQ